MALGPASGTFPPAPASRKHPDVASIPEQGGGGRGRRHFLAQGFPGSAWVAAALAQTHGHGRRALFRRRPPAEQLRAHRPEWAATRLGFTAHLCRELPRRYEPGRFWLVGLVTGRAGGDRGRCLL